MELTGIAILYLICLGVGFLFALVGAIFGELGHGGVEAGGHEISVEHGGLEVGDQDIDFGHELDISHEVAGDHPVGMTEAGHGPDASFLNSITISVFTAFFGLSGLFAVYVMGLTALPSLAFAVPVALVVAVAQFALYVRLFVHAQASSEATLAEVLGCEAEVITCIPGDRVGEIAYVIKGSRYTSPAVSADGEDLPRGTRVRVVNIKAAMLVVRPV